VCGSQYYDSEMGYRIISYNLYNIKLYYYVVEITYPFCTIIINRSVGHISKSKSSKSLKIRVRDTLGIICSLLLDYIILHIIFLTLDSVHYYYRFVLAVNNVYYINGMYDQL